MESGVRVSHDCDMYDDDCADFLSSHPEESVGTFGDNTNEDDYNVRGRLPNNEKKERLAGVEFRERLRARFAEERMTRPSVKSI